MAEECREVTIGIRPASPDDIDNIVCIHRQAFAGFFLTRLGDRFLALYYRAVLDFDGGILLIAKDSTSSTLGFVAGFSDTSEFYRRLKQRRFAIALAIFFPLLRSPGLIRRLFASSSLAGERIDADEDARVVELSSIAVGADGRGKGVGKRLLDGFCNDVLSRGSASIVLTTDAVDNDTVNQFYVDAGFAQTRAFTTAAGRAMNEYRLELARHGNADDNHGDN